MSESPYRVCPECGSEFVATATTCSDCAVALVSPAELAREQAEIEAFPPAAELECARAAPIPWIQALSEALQERGVPHRVAPVPEEQMDAAQREVFGDAQLFGLYLREQDLAEAREIDSGIAAVVLPGEAPDLEEGEEDACPACGAALAAHGTECPECGLVLG